MSGGERTDGGAREHTAGEGLFDRTDGAIHGLPERTYGRAAGSRRGAPSRTLVLARVAAPRRGSDVPAHPTRPFVALLDQVRGEPCDFLPPPEDGVPEIRPRSLYTFDGATRPSDEVTSEVRRGPYMDEVAARTPEPAATEAPQRAGGVRTWLERLSRWWR